MDPEQTCEALKFKIPWEACLQPSVDTCVFCAEKHTKSVYHPVPRYLQNLGYATVGDHLLFIQWVETCK